MLLSLSTDGVSINGLCLQSPFSPLPPAVSCLCICVQLMSLMAGIEFELLMQQLEKQQQQQQQENGNGNTIGKAIDSREIRGKSRVQAYDCCHVVLVPCFLPLPPYHTPLSPLLCPAYNFKVEIRCS